MKLCFVLAQSNTEAVAFSRRSSRPKYQWLVECRNEAFAACSLRAIPGQEDFRRHGHSDKKRAWRLNNSWAFRLEMNGFHSLFQSGGLVVIFLRHHFCWAAVT